MAINPETITVICDFAYPNSPTRENQIARPGAAARRKEPVRFSIQGDAHRSYGLREPRQYRATAVPPWKGTLSPWSETARAAGSAKEKAPGAWGRHRGPVTHAPCG